MNRRKPQTTHLPCLVVNLGVILSVKAVVDLPTIALAGVMSLTQCRTIGYAVGMVVVMVVIVVPLSLVLPMVTSLGYSSRFGSYVRGFGMGMVEVLVVIGMARRPSVVAMKIVLVIALRLVEAKGQVEFVVIGLLVVTIYMEGRKQSEYKFRFELSSCYSSNSFL